MPITITDAVTPNGPFTFTGYAGGDFGADDSLLSTNAFTTVAIDPNHFQLTFQPHGVGSQPLYMTATTPDGRSVTDTVGYGATAATDATSRFLAGGSDASTGLDAGDGYMLVADDEYNVIGLYPTDRSGMPVRSWDFTAVQNQDLWLGGQKAKERDIALGYGGFLGAWVKTAKETFPHIYVFGTDNDPGSGLRETFVVVASKTALDIDALGGRDDDPKFFSSDRLDNSLPNAVNQFFLNGGSDAFVVALRPSYWDSAGANKQFVEAAIFLDAGQVHHLAARPEVALDGSPVASEFLLIAAADRFDARVLELAHGKVVDHAHKSNPDNSDAYH